MRSSRFSRGVLGAGLLVAVFSACAAPGDDAGGAPPARFPADAGLRATLALDGAAFTAGDRPVVTVTITNTGARPEQLLSWYVGEDELAAPILAVWRDGAPVAYRGPLVKRTAPAADDYVTLAPGASVARRIDVADVYDLSQSGDYVVRVQVASAELRGVRADDARHLISADLAFWAEGRTVLARPVPPGDAGPITFTGRCTASEQAQLTQAVDAATTMSGGAGTYLGSTPPSGTPRYVTWFGAFSAAGWNTASAHYDAIHAAFANQPIGLDCKCKQKNVYAYVNPNDPYNIHLCGAFWPAPMTGTDSKAGTLIHEMSHFNVTASTDDWAYGQTACRNLAISDPTRALDNADSHEYFAENTPVQP